MENAGDVDQFASLITPNCQPTPSQDEKLQSCPFVRESEEFSGMDSSSSDAASEQPTGILMLTLPESSDDYQTPPEQQFYSQNSSNDGQVPATKAAAAATGVDRESESGGVQDGEMTVADDGSDRKENAMVDQANESDNIGFLEKSHVILHEEDTDKVLEDDNTLMVDLNDIEWIESEHLADENNSENSVTDASNIPSKENADKVFVEMAMREQEASMSDTEVSSNMGTNRKRKLPILENGPEKDETEEDDDDDDPTIDEFIDILDIALKILRREEPDVDSDDEDVDFLETAKLRGMTFPRPRWWPPKGDEGSNS